MSKKEKQGKEKREEYRPDYVPFGRRRELRTYRAMQTIFGDKDKDHDIPQKPPVEEINVEPTRGVTQSKTIKEQEQRAEENVVQAGTKTGKTVEHIFDAPPETKEEPRVIRGRRVEVEIETEEPRVTHSHIIRDKTSVEGDGSMWSKARKPPKEDEDGNKIIRGRE